MSPNMRVGGCEWECGVVETWAWATGAGGGVSLGVCTVLQRAGELTLKTKKLETNFVNVNKVYYSAEKNTKPKKSFSYLNQI